MLSSVRLRATVIAAALLSASCAGAPARSASHSASGWLEIESQHFRLVTDLEPDVAARELDLFERAYDAMMQAAFPRGAAGRMRVVVFESNDELHAFAPNHVAGLFVDGWALEDDETGTALFAGGLRDETRAVFQHELAHRLLAAGFADVPPWFSEGLATYFESMRVERDRVILGDWSRPYAFLPIKVSTRRLTALDRDAFYLGAERRDVSDEDGRRVATRYFLSWHLVHLLRNGPDPIRERFRGVIKTVNEGGSFEDEYDAFVRDVGEEELDRAFNAHALDQERLSSIFAYTPSPATGPPKTRDLSVEETHVLFAKLLFRRSPQRALREIDAALRQSPSYPEARLARAYVQLAAGDEAGATNAFTAMIDESKTSGPALTGLLHALLDKRKEKPSGADAERIHDLAVRLSAVATTTDEHGMTVGGLAAAGDFDRALAASEAATRAHPTSYRLLASRAWVLAKVGRFRDATTVMRRALEVMPERRARSDEGRALARRLAEYRTAAERGDSPPPGRSP